MLTLELPRGGSPPDFSSARQVNAWRDERGLVCARLFSGPAYRGIDWPGLGVFWFDADARAVQALPAAGVPADLLEDTFARALQPAILQALGWEALHASAVLGPQGIFAFCGPAHAGKSTLAYALAQNGFRHFADDALVISVENGAVRAHWLPFNARLRTPAAQHFEGRSGHSASRDTRTVAPVAAFFLLKQDDSVVGLPQRVPIAPARAFSELMTHAHCFDGVDPAESRRLVEDYLSIVSQVPVFSLAYRPGLDQLGELLQAVIGDGALAMTVGA